jgi:hypothetical protein
MSSELRVEAQKMYGVVSPPEQVKYAPAPVPVAQTIPFPEQYKYAPAPTPVVQTVPYPVPPATTLPPAPTGDTYEDIYGTISPAPSTTLPPAPTGDTYEDIYGTVSPAPSTTLPPAPTGDTYEDIYGTGTTPEIIVNPPAPVVEPPKEQVDTQEDISGISGQESTEAVASAGLNIEEVVNAKKFTEEITTIINDISSLNDNVGTISGAFGDTISYSSSAVKENFDLLKDFSENNFLKAMNNVSQYKNNLSQMKEIVQPILGEFSLSQFDSNGNLVALSQELKEEHLTEFSKAEELFRQNKQLKDQLQVLANNKINRIN